jgi:hypothetical protein
MAIALRGYCHVSGKTPQLAALVVLDSNKISRRATKFLDFNQVPIAGTFG